MTLVSSQGLALQRILPSPMPSRTIVLQQDLGRGGISHNSRPSQELLAHRPEYIFAVEKLKIKDRRSGKQCGHYLHHAQILETLHLNSHSQAAALSMLLAAVRAMEAASEWPFVVDESLIVHPA